MEESDDDIRTISVECSDDEVVLAFTPYQEEEELQSQLQSQSQSQDHAVNERLDEMNEIIETTCWGCRVQDLNQHAHMHPGGCLYDELVEIEEILSIPIITEVTDAVNDALSDVESIEV